MIIMCLKLSIVPQLQYNFYINSYYVLIINYSVPHRVKLNITIHDMLFHTIRCHSKDYLVDE
jgi:hypothetical protein